MNWTPERLQRLAEHRNNGRSVKQLAHWYRCSEKAIWAAYSKATITGKEALPDAYYEGVMSEGEECPYGMAQMKERCAWLAGSADEDRGMA